MAAFLRGDAHCVAAISEEAGSTSAVVRAWACSYLDSRSTSELVPTYVPPDLSCFTYLPQDLSN